MKRQVISKSFVLVVCAALAAASPVFGQPADAKMSTATRALFSAVQARDIDAARLSLSNGADIDAENDSGQTAADLAVDSGYFDIAHLILAVRSQRRAGAVTQPAPELPPPPPVFPRAPPLDEEARPKPEPVPQVGPPVTARPTISVAAAPMAAPEPQADLPAPVSLFRPAQPVPRAAAPPANDPFAQPAVQPVPPVAPSPPPARQPETLALPATGASSTHPEPIIASDEQGNPLTRAFSGIGSFFKQTFGQDGEGDAETEPASGGTPSDGNSSAAPAADRRSEAGPVPDERAAITPERGEESTEVATGPILKGVTLSLDGVSLLGAVLEPEAVPSCLERRRGTTHFCVEAAHWPEDLAHAVSITNRVYRGDQMVVRYDDRAATRMYALFPSENFAHFALYLQQRYGTPSQRLTQRRGMIAEPSRVNVVLRWISEDPKTDAQTVLEVRKFDDLRGMVPDTDAGVIRLFRPGSEEIFKYLSDSDFVLLRLREGSKKRPKQ